MQCFLGFRNRVGEFAKIMIRVGVIGIDKIQRTIGRMSSNSGALCSKSDNSLWTLISDISSLSIEGGM